MKQSHLRAAFRGPNNSKNLWQTTYERGGAWLVLKTIIFGLVMMAALFGTVAALGFIGRPLENWRPKSATEYSLILPVMLWVVGGICYMLVKAGEWVDPQAKWDHPEVYQKRKAIKAINNAHRKAKKDVYRGRPVSL